MRVLLTALVLISGCAAPRRVDAVIALLRARDFNGALAFPEKLDLMLRQHVRDLRRQHADPADIVRVTGFWLDHWPFALKDLPLDADALEELAETAVEARTGAGPPRSECRNNLAASDFDSAIAALESGGDDHDDGGRCALHFYRVFKRHVARPWTALKGTRRFSGAPGILHQDDVASQLLLEFLERFNGKFADDVPLFLCILRYSQERIREGERPQWQCLRWGLRVPDRLAKIHRAWLSCQDWPVDRGILGGAGAALEGSGATPELRAAGLAIRNAAEAIDRADTLPATAYDLCWEASQLCAGNDFGAGIWSAFIQWCGERGLHQTGEKAIAVWSEAFGAPRFGGEALHHLAHSASESRHPAESRRLLERVIRDFPRSKAVAWSHVGLARIELKAGRWDAALAHLKPVLSGTPRSTWPSEPFSFASAHSSAQRTLAELHEARFDWPSAWSAWRDWQPPAGCIPGEFEGIKDERVRFCLEVLGRDEPAVAARWKASLSPGGEADLAARHLLAIFDARRKRDAFILIAKEQLETLRGAGGEADSSGLARVLADVLK